MWKCPECRGAQGRLRIEGVLTTVVIDADGESAEPVGDLEWNGTAVAHCPCGFRGTAADCETEDDEEGDSDMNATTTAEIRDYTTGRVIGDAEVNDDVMERYESQEIGQWPEGILAASDLLSDAEIERLGIESNTTVWIEQ